MAKQTVESQICIFSIHFSIPFSLTWTSQVVNIMCKRASNMVFNYIFVFSIWFRFCSFSCGILPLSTAAATFAAILWNSMLQVSTRKTSHMGRSGMTWTWFVSYWFEQTHLKKSRSKASTWKSTIESHVGRALFRVTWKFIRSFLSCGGWVDICTWLLSRIQASTPRRFTFQHGHVPISVDVVVYVLSTSMNFRRQLYFFVIYNAFAYAYRVSRC